MPAVLTGAMAGQTFVVEMLCVGIQLVQRKPVEYF